MSHCLEHVRKWKRDRNFCGLGDRYADEIDEWVALVDKICKNGGAGLDEDFVVDHFTAGAARPLIRCHYPEIKTKALNYVLTCLKRGETVTGGDLETTIKGFKENAGIKSKPKKGRGSSTSENVTIVTTETTPDIDDKPAPSGEVLADRLKNDPHGSSSFHTASEELAAKKNGIAGEMFPAGNSTEIPKSSPAWSPEVCKTGPCPDGKAHSSHDKVRGVCCDLTGQPVNQIKDCPYLERQKRAAAQAASGPAVLQARPITTERPPVNVIPVQLTKAEAEAAITSIIRGYFTPKSREQWEQVKKAGGWDTDLEALEGLRDDAAERIA